jgi:SAM-dependent methyltransferase
LPYVPRNEFPFEGNISGYSFDVNDRRRLEKPFDSIASNNDFRYTRVKERVMKEMTSANKRGWDKLAEIHYRNYHIDRLLSGKPLLDELVQKEVGDVSGKTLAHLLCHIGTDTLSWALLGAKVTGIDISSESLKYARQLSDRMNIDAEFIECDVLDVVETIDRKFDIVFSSTGVLCWIPDITIYARAVRHLLNDGGLFYILDGHPFRGVFLDEAGEADEAGEDRIRGDYFRSKVFTYHDFGDYTDAGVKFDVPSYEWNWTIGQIVTAFCDAGMRIEFLHEFPKYFYNGYTPAFGESEEVVLYPCVFSLKALR